jgi:hypothetical protein
MTPATAVLDVVDRSFLWHADQARRQPSRLPQGRDAAAGKTERELATSLSVAPVAKPLHAEPVIAASIHPEPVTDDGMGSLVDRLLRVVPHAWAHLATRVEDAHREGAEVIAITGARRGEGRTTVVECLKQTLVALGRRVECLDSAPLELASRGRDRGSIVLVDAGIWFPTGPLRRAWLERQSLGCHAVILVRRADQPACEARAAALEASGLKVLGEVLTMTPPATSGVRVA